MLGNIIGNFIKSCNLCNFSKRSLDAFRLNLYRFNKFLIYLNLKTLDEIEYSHLVQFVTINNSSLHTKKQRIWTLRQFFHYLKLNRIIKENIAGGLPYPKIDTKESKFFSINELKQILDYFIKTYKEPADWRNLVIVLFLSFLGLRLDTIVKLNIQDIDFPASKLLVLEKGGKIRQVPLPQVIFCFLNPYIKTLDRDIGPLFVSNRKKRISGRMVQHILAGASKELGIKIKSHQFRHTAATELNQVAGIDVTKEVLGHRRRQNTKKYAHLNPEIYAEYMRRHPFMDKELQEVI